jgi:alkylhydroperoxidase family enzyme
VRAVCEDFEGSPLPEREKALLRYLAVVNDRPAEVAEADVLRAKAAGWDDAALFDAASVCAIFNFFNRWIDATGVPDVPDRFYEKRLAAQGDTGYAL